MRPLPLLSRNGLAEADPSKLPLRILRRLLPWQVLTLWRISEGLARSVTREGPRLRLLSRITLMGPPMFGLVDPLSDGRLGGLGPG